MLLVAAIIPSGCKAPVEAPPPGPTPTPAAEFEVTSLDVTPPEVVAGETVNVTVEVTNTGASEGTYSAMLTIDRAEVQKKDVVVAVGATEIATFSLVEDTPGSYQIGIGELTSTIIVEVKEVELKHDDGTSDESWSIGGKGRGHLVHFSPPVGPFTINKVKIYGSLYGVGYEKLVCQIEIWDEDFNILHSYLESHTTFSRQPSWVEMAIPSVVVDGDFYIFVCTSSPKESGIQIHYDSSVINVHSEVTEARKIADWYLEETPKEEVNWMIRAVGSQASIPSSAEEKPAAKKVELKYDGGSASPHGCSGWGPGWGCSVHFSPPTIPFTLVEVRLLAKLRTGYLHDKAIIEIWDKDFNVLYSSKKPATEFTPQIEWTTIDIPNITVDSDFRVVFFSNGKNTKEGGVRIFYDYSGNKGSELGKSGGGIRGWPESHCPTEKSTNWMIRVVGICSGDVIPVSPPLPEPPGTMPRFQRVISSLDTPEKLSQWMMENLTYDSRRGGFLKTGGRLSPARTLSKKYGGFSEFAMFACAVLEHHGYETAILSIVVYSDPSKGHVLCVYWSGDSLYTINIDQIEGPYQAYEDIAFAHHKDWSKYSLYHSWGTYQKLGYPDEVVYGE